MINTEGGDCMSLPDFLLRLLIGALVLFIGDRILGLVTNASAKQALDVILVIVVVLYIIFGAILPIK